MDISTLNVWAEPVLIVVAATCWIFAAWQLHLRMNGHAEWISRVHGDLATSIHEYTSNNLAYREAVAKVFKEIDNEIYDLTHHLKRDVKELRNYYEGLDRQVLYLCGEINKIEGLSTKHHINAKVARELANRAHEQALLAHVKAEGLQKSTHSVQFMPIEKVLARNADVINKANKLANPEDEQPEWMAPFEGLDDDFTEQPKRRV